VITVEAAGDLIETNGFYASIAVCRVDPRVLPKLDSKTL
jgi:hypothetical protein